MRLPANAIATIGGTAILLLVPILIGIGRAELQAYPTRAVTLIVPAPAGGTTDIAARMISDPLARVFGQAIVIDNRPGASGMIATSAVARAQPDGYTLLMQYSGYQTISPLITKNLGWDPVRDFVPIANVLTAPQLLVVRPDLPVRTLAELVAYAKANPGKLNYATPGAGSLAHLTGELLKQRTGIEMTHVPYKGMAPAVTDLLSGTVDLTFATAPPMFGLLQAGKLRPLAILAKTRLSVFPDIPTAAEAGFEGLDAPVWFAAFAPKATPPVIISKLGSEIAKIMKTEEFKRKAAEQGAAADYKNSAELAQVTQTDLMRWGQVVKSANIHE